MHARKRSASSSLPLIINGKSAKNGSFENEDENIYVEKNNYRQGRKTNARREEAKRELKMRVEVYI